MSSPTSENSSQRIQSILNAKPSKSREHLYMAIIFGLVLHVFVLGVVYIVTHAPQLTQEEVESEAIEEIELSFAEEEEMQQSFENSNMSEEVRNLLASSASERIREKVNFTGKSQEQIEQEVTEYLKGLEQSEYDALKSTHKDYSVPAQNKESSKDQAKPKDDYEWYKNQSDKSYAGPVSAEYDVKGRTANKSPKPTYRCKTAGKVVVKITVDELGNVTDAEIDESKTTGNDCIRTESVSYAKRWQFGYKEGLKKTPGTITFTFAAQ